LFLQTGYRKPSNYTDEALEAAGKGLRGLYAGLEALRAIAAGLPTAVHCAVEAAEFDAFLDNDLDTAGALGWLQTRVKEARTAGSTEPQAAHAVVSLAERCLDIFGLPPSAAAAGLERQTSTVTLTEDQRVALQVLAGDGGSGDAALIDRIIALRDRARAGKDFATSDRLRDALQNVGVALRDTKSGTQWSLDDGR
jgi:cysteinyl-tRNA synthetase